MILVILRWSSIREWTLPHPWGSHFLPSCKSRRTNSVASSVFTIMLLQVTLSHWLTSLCSGSLDRSMHISKKLSKVTYHSDSWLVRSDFNSTRSNMFTNSTVLLLTVPCEIPSGLRAYLYKLKSTSSINSSPSCHSAPRKLLLIITQTFQAYWSKDSFDTSLSISTCCYLSDRARRLFKSWIINYLTSLLLYLFLCHSTHRSHAFTTLHHLTRLYGSVVCILSQCLTHLFPATTHLRLQRMLMSALFYLSDWHHLLDKTQELLSHPLCSRQHLLSTNQPTHLLHHLTKKTLML